MRSAVIAAALFWAGGIALALHACGATGQGFHVEAPPERYIAPTIARVQLLPLAAARAACIRQGIPLHVNPVACAWIAHGQCHIILPYPRDVGYETAGRLLEHEPAHCWGWVHA